MDITIKLNPTFITYRTDEGEAIENLPHLTTIQEVLGYLADTYGIDYNPPSVTSHIHP